jgi:hypothetical protein
MWSFFRKTRGSGFEIYSETEGNGEDETFHSQGSVLLTPMDEVKNLNTC